MRAEAESKWVDRFTTRPMKYFAIAFGVSIVALAALLQLISAANTGEFVLIRTLFGNFTTSLASIDATSAALQAVIGTAVVGASAIVALLVAVAALRASQMSNVLADPDYVLSHSAYSAYRKYGFLFGSLIASYRTYRHEAELASYTSAPTTPSDTSSAGSHAPRPRWDSILAELRTLLLDTPFQVAALEAAKVLELGGGDENQHRLRKAFANALSALEQQVDSSSKKVSAEHSLTVLLAQASLLDAELRRGLDAVKELDLPSRPPEEGNRLLHYLHQWMQDIGSLQIGEDFRFAARANAFAGEEFASMLGNTSWQKMFNGLLDEVFITNKHWRSGLCVDPFENGLHRAMTIAAVCGDHTTAMQLREQAQAFARAQGFIPMLVVVRNKASLPPPANQEAKIFHIFHVTRKTLPLLFGRRGSGYGDVLGPHTRGCVIVDGLRSADIANIEAKVANRAQEMAAAEAAEDTTETPASKENCVNCRPCKVCGRCGLCDNCKNHSPSRLDIFVDVLTEIAYGPGHTLQLGKLPVYIDRVSSHLTDEGEPGVEFSEQDEVPAALGPKLVWVGLDYRQLGVEPPSVLDDWSSEMWSIFNDYGASVSDEVRALTNM